MEFHGVIGRRQEAEKSVIDLEQILAMLTRISEPLAGDLGKSTAAVEADGCKWVGIGGVDLPCNMDGRVLGRGDGIMEEPFVVTPPRMCFARKGVGSIRCSLVMTVDLVKRGWWKGRSWG